MPPFGIPAAVRLLVVPTWLAREMGLLRIRPRILEAGLITYGLCRVVL